MLCGKINIAGCNPVEIKIILESALFFIQTSRSISYMTSQFNYFCQPANGHESKDKSNAIDQKKSVCVLLAIS